MKNQYLLYNDQFFSLHEELFTIEELEQFAFSEDIRAIRNQIPFWKEHLELIHLKLRLLNWPLPDFLTNHGKGLKRQIERLLIKNKLFHSAIIHLRLIKTKKKISYILRTQPLSTTSYPLNKTGIEVDIFHKTTKDSSPISSLNWGSLPFWQVANSDPLKLKYDELLLINRSNSILEAPSKNIYANMRNHILTPSPAIGAYIDVSQGTMEKVCTKLGMQLKFVDQLTIEQLLNADELFLVNSLQGIEWVKAFRQKRYFNKNIKLIHREFNQLLLV